MPDIVYQLKRCEEYWMQEDHGLFSSKEKAIAAIGPHVLIADRTDVLLVVTCDEDHYAKPDCSQVTTRQGVVITPDNITEYTSGYDFYDITHKGYQLWGVFALEVS